MRGNARRASRVVVAAGLLGLAGGLTAVLAGACSDPFSSEGYVSGDGGAASNGDATMAIPEAGTGGKTVPGDEINDTTCMVRSCSAMGIECGTATNDGCGRQLNCGDCHHFGDVCVDNKCVCTPKSADAGDCVQANGTPLCSLVPDGCGGLYTCPACTSGTCQADNTCGAGTCMPRGVPTGSCGTISDGCGSDYTLPACPADPPNDNSCSGGTEPYVCGCTPFSCGQQGFACSTGPIDDQCGGTVDCGGCVEPPGQCNAQQLCNTCTRVSHIFGYDDQCMTGAHPYAWACDCVDGGACTVPDGVKATPPHCKQLLNTSQHAIYCCDETN